MMLRLLLFILTAVSATPYILKAQTLRTADDYLDAIETAYSIQNKELTLRLLNSALNQYPNNMQLLLRRGNFYNDENLYRLALTDFLRLEKLGYANEGSDERFLLYDALTNIYGKLDDAENGLVYAKKFYNAFPLEEIAAGSLLWAYQKAFQFEEGISVGKHILRQIPQSYNVKALISLLYSAIFDYANARKFSNEAIAMASSSLRPDYGFLLTTLYNQYLLEMRFYNYAEAERCLRQASDIMETSTIYRSWGAMYHDQLDYYKAREYFELSNEAEMQEEQRHMRERTPFAYFGLIDLYLTFGEPFKAEKLLNEVSRLKNISWMRNYGMNSDIYYEELYRLYSKLWEQKHALLRYQPQQGLTKRFLYLPRRIRTRFYSFYYTSLTKSYALKNGRLKILTNNYLPAYQHYLLAAQDFPLQKKFFLTAAEELEEAFIKKPLPYYKARQAVLAKNKAALLEAYALFDDHYEQRMQATVLRDLIRLEHRTAQKDRYIENLYKINSGITKLYALPLTLKIQSSDKQFKKRLQKCLARSFRIRQQSLYSLEVIHSDNTVYIVLKEGAMPVFNDIIDFPENTGKSIFRLADVIYRQIYMQQ
jgi:hypothetical protein